MSNHYRHDPMYKGIAIQHMDQDIDGKPNKPGFMITFPYLPNVLPVLEGQGRIMFPKGPFKTYRQAFLQARAYQEALSDSIGFMPIYLLEAIDRRCYKPTSKGYNAYTAKNYYQLVG